MVSKTGIITRAAVAAVAIVSVVWYCITAWRRYQETRFDDAYMYLRYAKHWLSGSGFSWNSADGPVYGVTSTSHLLLVTAIRGLTSLRDASVLTIISSLAGLASVAVMTIVGFVFFGHLRRSWAPLLVVPCMILSPLFLFHSATGMETTLATLFNSVFIAFLLFFVTRRSTASFILCLGAAYVAFLTRPDVALYCLLLPPLLLMTYNVLDWKRGLLYAAGFVALVCCDLLLKKVLFGDFLPLSVFVKSAGFYRGYMGAFKWNAAHETFVFFRDSLPFLLAVILLASRKTLPRLIAIFLPMLLTFGYFATMIQITGRSARYYYPSLPFLILGAFVAADRFALEHCGASSRLCIPRWSRIVIALVSLGVLASPPVEHAVSASWQKWMIGEGTPIAARSRYERHAPAGLPSLGWWRSIEEMDSLLRNLPSDIVIAASEIGYIGAEHPTATVIDLTGLNDRYLAHEGFSARYLFSRMPDIIWFPHGDYTYEISEMLDSGAFKEHYDYYPDAYDYGIAIRRDSESSAGIDVVLEGEFARIYSGRVLSDYKAEPRAEPRGE